MLVGNDVYKNQQVTWIDQRVIYNILFLDSDNDLYYLKYI